MTGLLTTERVPAVDERLQPVAVTDRGLDHGLHEHVAMRRRAQHRHALAGQPELVAALGAGRDVDARPLAAQGKDVALTLRPVSLACASVRPTQASSGLV